jgi:hypothetical protein
MEPVFSVDLGSITLLGLLFGVVALGCGLTAGLIRARSRGGGTFALIRFVLFLGGVLAGIPFYQGMGSPFEDHWWRSLVAVAPLMLGMTLGELVASLGSDTQPGE